MASSSSEDSESETSIHGELPQGSERDLIEYYFNRGLPYKHITLMLEKHHNIAMNERTLKRRLKNYGCSRRHEVDNQLRRRVRDIILLEIRNGPSAFFNYISGGAIAPPRERICSPSKAISAPEVRSRIAHDCCQNCS